jgi:hypothetical protein
MRQFILAAATALFIAPALADEIAYTGYVEGMQVSSDFSALPEPVRVKRQQLIEIANAGDTKSLQAVVSAQSKPTQFASLSTDPVIALRENSADPQGHQMLAVMRNLLDMPYAVIWPDTAETLYIWPYLANVNFEHLTPRVSVDIYRLSSHEEYLEALDFDGWFGWRVVMDKDGNWLEFVNGD